MFFQSCRWQWKGTSTRDFFKLSKKSLPHGCLHSLATFCKLFAAKNKGKKQQHYKKLKQIWHFNVIIIAECSCKISCTFEGSVINQSSSTQPPVATFSLMALFGSWTTCYVSATCEMVSHIYMLMFLSLQYTTMVSFILSTTFFNTEIHSGRDSAKCPLLGLYS